MTPFSQVIQTGSDGSYSLPGLTPGTYSYCGQNGDGYVNGCRWGQPPGLTVTAGRKATADIRIVKGSIVKVQIADPGNASLTVNNNRGVPPILMGIWDGQGHFLPARMTGKEGTVLNYQLTIPFNTPLTFQALSAKLKLADSVGAAGER